jgi:signal transduction histidine kinase
MNSSVGSVFKNIFLPLDYLNLGQEKTQIRRRLYRFLAVTLALLPFLILSSLFVGNSRTVVSTFSHTIFEVLFLVLSLIIIYAISHEYMVSRKPSAFYLFFAFLWMGAGDFLQLFSAEDIMSLIWFHTLSVFIFSLFYFLCVRSLPRKKEIPLWLTRSVGFFVAAATLVGAMVIIRAAITHGPAGIGESLRAPIAMTGFGISSLSPLTLLYPAAIILFLSGFVLLKHFRETDDLVSLALSAAALLFAQNEILYCFSRPWTPGWWSSYFIKLIILTGLCYGIARVLRGSFYKLHKSREHYKNLVNEVTRSYEHLRDTQERLSETEKLASIGRLAATISHEVRNPLGAIKNVVDIFKNQRQCSGQEAELLGIIEKEINRLNKIVTDFLEFSRPARLSKEKADLHAVIDDALVLFRHNGQGASQIAVKKEFDACMPAFYMDRDAMKQVFLNIFINSLQAMTAGGTLTVQTIYEEKLLNDQRYREASVVMTDTGPGMTADTLSKIFQPFFTTKTRGSGLGLCVVQRNIRQHGGTVSIASSPETGTTTTVSLPVE